MTIKNKLIASTIVVGLTLLVLVKRSTAASVTLYDGASGVAPYQLGAAPNGPFFTYGQISTSCPLGCTIPNPPTSQTVNSGVTLNTNFNSNDTGYSGYSTYTYSFPKGFTPVSQNLPTLDPSTGFSISFNVAVANESSQSNRSGFSVIVIGNDKQGVELGFKSGSIFTQNSNFTQGESVSYNTSATTNYTLAVNGNNYTLSYGSQSLTGKTRNYAFDPTTSQPPLPYNPYTTANYLFFGDDTDQGSSTFTLGTVTANTATVPYEFSPSLGILILAGCGGVTQVLKKKRLG